MSAKKRFGSFSIRSLLIVTALLAIPMQWWIGTPKRTATRFANAISAGDASQIASLCCNAYTLEEISRLDGVSVDRTEVVSAPRSLADVVFGRQLIKLTFFDDTGRLVDTIATKVTRFHISEASNDSPMFSFYIALQDVEPFRRLLTNQARPPFCHEISRPHRPPETGHVLTLGDFRLTARSGSLPMLWN